MRSPPRAPPVFLPERRSAASSESPSCLPARDSPPRGVGRGDQPGSSLFSLPISLVTRSLAAGRKRFYNCRDAGFELFARWLFLALNHREGGKGRLIGRGLDEKCYTPGVEVLAAGDSSRLTPEGCRVLVLGKIKSRGSWARHSILRSGHVGSAMAEAKPTGEAYLP